MKKTLLILVAIVFAVTACDKNTYVDGNYSATYDEPSNGWNTVLEFTLTDDEISNVDYDDFNDDGDRKSLDSAYNADMQKAVDTKPEVFIPVIESYIQNATIVPSYEPIDVDAISGATGFIEKANTLMEAALNAAANGESTEIVVPRPTE
jgi:major membrane immunogen (membrane-anchored lipoprotein)